MPASKIVVENVEKAFRIMVLTARPATLQAVFDVPFSHPRKLTGSGVQERRLAILRALGVDGGPA